MPHLHTIALANTFALIDLILHPLFHAWVTYSPGSYEQIMNLFVAGLRLQVTAFDTNITHIAIGTLVEAAGFWLLGASVALLYNFFTQRSFLK